MFAWVSACAADSSRSTMKLLPRMPKAMRAGGARDRQVDVVAVGGRRTGRHRDREDRAGALHVAQRRADRQVGAGRRAGGGDQAGVAVLLDVGEAEARAQLALEVIVDDHDARLDQHLAHRDVEGRHQAADVGEAVGGVLHQQGVGALIDRHAAARRQQRVGLRLDQRRHVRGLGVVDLQVLGAQRRELLHVLPGRQLRLLARRQLRLRRDDDDVVLLALVEALGAQHDVQRLVPGHVLQAQRDVAAHRVADHDVLAAGIGQQLQHGARLDVLEVERQALAGVHRLVLRPRSAPCGAAAPRPRTGRRTGRRAARSRRSR